MRKPAEKSRLLARIGLSDESIILIMLQFHFIALIFFSTQFQLRCFPLFKLQYSISLGEFTPSINRAIPLGRSGSKKFILNALLELQHS